MKRLLLPFLILATGVLNNVRAETETIDLKALAKKARPAVLLLVVSDAAGKEIATGTGFLVSSDGKLITNHHVIENAASAVAKAENGGLFPVEGVLADDPKNDLVLLKLKGKDLLFLPLGNSDKIDVGTRIAVIGSPLGLEGTLSEGIVSAVRELMDDMKVLQITAAVSPGSSGSPVLDAKGEVIGIAAGLVEKGQALNFAVPVEAGRELVKNPEWTEPRSLPDWRSDYRSDWTFADVDEFMELEKQENWIDLLKLAKVKLSTHPKSSFALFYAGKCYYHLGFVNDAIDALKESVHLYPKHGDAWLALGSAYAAAKNWSEAVKAYGRGVALETESDKRLRYPSDSPQVIERRMKKWAEIWVDFGAAYEAAGNCSDAIAAYQNAIKSKPDSAEAWFKLGTAYRAAGRANDATDAFQRAKKLKPELFK